jgi:hypothetical protein
MVEVAAATKLLDFSQPTDVGLLESTVALMYGAGSGEQVRARTQRSACSVPAEPLPR